MSNDDRSSFLLRDFEPSAVRLKRKLRLILNRNLRQDKIGEKQVTLTEFVFYLVFLIVVLITCTINRTSEEIFHTNQCFRRLLAKKLALGSVRSVDQFWSYLDRFNNELYRHVVEEKSVGNESRRIRHSQLLLLDENFLLGHPRLRQLRVHPIDCQWIEGMNSSNITCYPPYDPSKESREQITSLEGQWYEYTSSSALSLSNIRGPYGTGGFIYEYRPTKTENDEDLKVLRNERWLNSSTRAVFIELISFNPNTELLSSINILFEFLTTGSVETKEFFHTIPINGYFFGRKKFLGVAQIFAILGYIVFGFYYVGKLAEHRLWFIMSSYWNFYDLGLLIFFTVSFYFDILFVMNISSIHENLSRNQIDIFKSMIDFIQIQLNRDDFEALKSATLLIRLLKFSPHFSRFIENLLAVFYRSIRNSIGFLLLFFLIFISFVFFATFHYGDELHEFHTFAWSSYTLIRCTLGQFEYDRAFRVSPRWTPIFYMLYVCVVFFVLLNLLVAVVNEAYVLGKQEQKQLEDDLHEEFLRRTNQRDLNAFRRSQRPILQMSLIRLIRFLPIVVDEDGDDEISTTTSEISSQENRIVIEEKLRKILVDENFSPEIIEKFFARLTLKIDEDEDDETFLYEEFRLFHRQYEKLAQDWRKTTFNTRQMILLNTVDREESKIIEEKLKFLHDEMKIFAQQIPKALENVVQLYKNHLTIY